MDGIALAAEDAARRRDVIGQDPVAAFLAALGLRIGDDILGLGGEADHQFRPAVAGFGQRREDVGILDQFQRGQRSGLFLQLRGRGVGAPIGDRGGTNRDIGRQRSLACRQHLARRLDAHDFDARRIGLVGRARDQHAIGAEPRQRSGNGMALAAGGAVGDVAHGIDRLLRRAAGDERAAAAQRRIGDEDLFDRGDDLQRLGHAAHAAFILGERPGIGPDLLDAARCEPRQILLRRFMFPHAEIHRRRDEDRLVGRQQRGRGEIVGDAGGDFRDDIRRRRRDDEEIAFLRQAQMAHLALIGQREEIGIGFLAGERRGRERRDELLRARGQDAAHARAALLEAPDEIERLISGNAARDDQQDAPAVQHALNFTR